MLKEKYAELQRILHDADIDYFAGEVVIQTTDWELLHELLVQVADETL